MESSKVADIVAYQPWLWRCLERISTAVFHCRWKDGLCRQPLLLFLTLS